MIESDVLSVIVKKYVNECWQESDYFKVMAMANNLDDTDTIKRIKRVLKRLSSD